MTGRPTSAATETSASATTRLVSSRWVRCSRRRRSAAGVGRGGRRAMTHLLRQSRRCDVEVSGTDGPRESAERSRGALDADERAEGAIVATRRFCFLSRHRGLLSASTWYLFRPWWL